MSLDLPSGAECFVDANVFYYAFTEDPVLSPPCGAFLDRGEASDLVAYTTVQVLADVVHKTMMTEVVHRSGQQRAGLIGWLNRHPEILGQLTTVAEIGQRLTALRARVLPVESAMLLQSIANVTTYRLLTNDALILAVMRARGLVHLATNDDDFDLVPGLTIWKPR